MRPTFLSMISTALRFWVQVDMNGPIPAHRPELGPCWLWKGRLLDGYGATSFRKRTAKAHRIAWLLKYGEWPKHYACHKCNNRQCVRWDHLFDGTASDNSWDGIRKGMLPQLTTKGNYQTKKTHCPRGHAYVPGNILRYNNKRYCRACGRVKSQIHRDRLRQQRA